MKQHFIKNITSFLELDDYITEITSNQIKILNTLEEMQSSPHNNTDLIENQYLKFNLKNIFCYTIGVVVVIGIIYYFTSGGGDAEMINNIYSNISQEILQKININTTIIDNNMKHMLDTTIINDNHLVDVINQLLIQNNEQINKTISIRIFNAILKNGRHLEDITKILEKITLSTNVENITTTNLKKVVFSDES